MKRLLAHLVGDYVVQSEWMAMEKTSKHVPALVHGATYAACFLPLTRNPRALVIIGGTHYIIDRYRLAKYVTWIKNQVGTRKYRPTDFTPTGFAKDKPDWMAVWLMIIADNTMHMVINELTLEWYDREK